MTHLTIVQRYQIEALKKNGLQNKDIAKAVNVHPSTISRELNRKIDGGIYLADVAHLQSINSHITKPKKLYLTLDMKNNIHDLLAKDYSPEQISGFLRSKKQDCVCTESIYTYIWADKKVGGTLFTYLRNKGKRYSKRGHSYDKRGQIKNRKDITERPVEVEKRERIGDLEIDLVIGQHHKGALVTINDRSSGFLRMKYIEKKEASIVEAAVIELLSDCKSEIKTITSDNGKEFANHENIAKALNIDYYFAKPYHSWERGSNENLNGLIKTNFPKGSSFESITKEKVNGVIERLNKRPRKRYKYKNPDEVHQELLKKVA